MTDTQATDVVTFDFKGTGVRCIVCGTIDYQMNFVLGHFKVCNDNRLNGMRHTCGIDRHKRQADRHV